MMLDGREQVLLVLPMLLVGGYGSKSSVSFNASSTDLRLACIM